MSLEGIDGALPTVPRKGNHFARRSEAGSPGFPTVTSSEGLVAQIQLLGYSQPLSTALGWVFKGNFLEEATSSLVG
jgi:hypothetical protein